MGMAFAGSVLISVLVLTAPVHAAKKPPSGSEELVIEGPRRLPDPYLTRWDEYTSAHFIVDSDLLTFVVAGLIEKLETMRAVELRALIADRIALPGRVRVIASGPGLLGDLARDQYYVGSGKGCQLLNRRCKQQAEEELTTAAPESVQADTCGHELFFTGNYFISRLGEPTIVLPLPGFRANTEAVAHLVAHHFASHLFLRPPPWLREGFAAFLETAGGETLDNSPLTGTHIQRGELAIRGAVGLMPPGFIAALCRDSASAKELLQWQGEETEARRGRYHSASWLLYHWLWNQRSKQLTDFQTRLASGEESAAAWREAFPEFNPDAPGALGSLDEALERHRRFGTARYYRTKADADTSYSKAPLSSADIHALLIDARYSASAPKDKSAEWLRSELHNVVLEEPLQPVAVSWRAELDHSSPLERLRKATRRWPEDWRAWLLLGQAADGAEKEAALQTALKLNPDSVLALNQLAFYLATSGRPSDALPLIRRAMELAPWNPEAAATLSAVDSYLGECAEAREVYQRAVRLASGARLPEQLAAVDRLCGAVSRP
jgi:tetratricopeptide (TPR) repeat protein